MLFRSKKEEKHYKFKDLKVYCSTEWLADNKKKYRQVFDSTDLSYIYTEFAFYNKLFDEQDWEAQITLKCYLLENEEEDDSKKLLHQVSNKVLVPLNENIVHIREGFNGKKEEYFWKKGTYIWEAFINEELVGNCRFYIEEAGNPTRAYNPYFTLQKAMLYEGSNSGVPLGERQYVRQFEAVDTRYVWVELVIYNDRYTSWMCELVFNFYNEAGQLKGRTTELRKINENDEDVSIITGWGTNIRGTWHQDNYRVEVVFMDELIAVIPFACGDKYVSGNVKMLTEDQIGIKIEEDADNQEEDSAAKRAETYEQASERITRLIELNKVVKKIHEHITYLDFLKIRREKGYQEKDSLNLHSAFIGNPGTGKTTIAKIIAEMYYGKGLLSKSKFMEVGRAELIGQYIGQTAPRVKELIEEARGGVLFIDEAYALARTPDDKDYGQEAIETLIKEMSDGAGDIAIFVAGHPQGMRKFFKSHPGLKSRFANIYHFPDYRPKELIEIAKIMAKEKGITFSPEAEIFLRKVLTTQFRKRDESFGNARYINHLLEEAKILMGVSYMNQLSQNQENILAEKTKEKIEEKTIENTEKQNVIEVDAIEMLQVEHLKNVFIKQRNEKLKIEIDNAELRRALHELEGMIGLERLKKEVHQLVSLVKYYRKRDIDVLEKFSLHTVFKGNPGTGKTTVARVIARIYKALGIIERGHLVECSREALVAGHVGQTAIKTRKLVKRSLGGVLFIDEAYSLLQGSEGDFGKEAIETLLKLMEDQRGKFAVIVAGYPEPMERFLEANPGLKSRFEQEFVFDDLSENELFSLALSLAKKEELFFDEAAAHHLSNYFKFLYLNRDKYFGNGRAVRKVMTQVIKNQNLRVAALWEKQQAVDEKRILLADVALFNAKDNPLNDSKKGIGFNMI